MNRRSTYDTIINNRRSTSDKLEYVYIHATLPDEAIVRIIRHKNTSSELLDRILDYDGSRNINIALAIADRANILDEDTLLNLGYLICDTEKFTLAERDMLYERVQNKIPELKTCSPVLIDPRSILTFLWM